MQSVTDDIGVGCDIHFVQNARTICTYRSYAQVKFFGNLPNRLSGRDHSENFELAAGKSFVNALELRAMLTGVRGAAPKDLRRRYPMELAPFSPAYAEQQCLFSAA